MLLTRVFKAPIESLIHMERYVNKGSPSGFDVTDCVSPQTSPKSHTPHFDLPVLAVDKKSVITKGDAKYFPQIGRGDDNTILYPVHPDILDEVTSSLSPKPKVAGTIPAIPSASARTVLSEDNSGPLWIKLHYPRLIGRFNRAIPGPKWISSFEKSAEICRHIRNQKCPNEFAMLPESSGVLLKPNEQLEHSAGVIFREFVPYPDSEQLSLIPIFSLFSVDSERPAEPLLLTQILSGFTNPFDACFELVIIPLLRCYRFMALDIGLIPEYNAQNILLGVNQSFSTIRIVHRDMMEPFIDLTLRRQLGLHTVFERYHYIDITTDFGEYFKRRSFEYDFKCGCYVFAELEEVLNKYYGFSRRRFRSTVRDLFRTVVTPTPEEYFGSANIWYAYPKLIPKGTRPYIARKHPRYR